LYNTVSKTEYFPTVDKATKEAVTGRGAQTFAENLKRLREKAGLSQEELGSRAGLHRTHIGYMENGTRGPRLPTIYLVAAALEVDAGLLLAESSLPPSPDQDSD
jgi:transcriptional regulator with XRE-family HTH domain